MRGRTPFLAFLGLAALLGAGSCANPQISDELVVLEVDSIPALDGFVRSDGTFAASGEVPCQGDLDGIVDGLSVRQFFAFDLSRIPENSKIVGVSMCMHMVEIVGDPYGTLGGTRIEHVVYGATLDAGDFDVPVLTDWGQVRTAGGLSGFCKDVTGSVQDDHKEGRGVSQWRLRFPIESDHDGVSDYVAWGDAELTSGDRLVMRPTLSIAFYPAY
jgi:hypothetical protein